MFCLKCGKEIPEYSNYCLYCGMALPGKNNDIIMEKNKGKTLIVVNCEKGDLWGKENVKIMMDGKNITDVKNGNSVSFEIEDGRHIIFCDAKLCKRSESIDFIANSNEIHFSIVFPLMYLRDVTLTLTKIMETEAGTWIQ
jgi:hypothetical protein